MPNLGFYLSESADRYPDSVALRCDGVTTTIHSWPIASVALRNS
jgi:hypothetical protein